MHIFAAALAYVFIFCGVFGVGHVHAAPMVTVPTVSADRDARFQSLCKSLANEVAAHNARIEEEQKARQGERVPETVPVQLSLELLAGKHPPTQEDAKALAHVLNSIAVRAPSLYRSILVDTELRNALFGMEKDFDVPFFATDESNRTALDLVDDLEELAARGLIPEEIPAEPIDELASLLGQRDGLKTSTELAETMRATRAMLSEFGQTPVPRLYATGQLMEAAKFLSPRLTADARAGSEPLMERLMQYVVGQSRWFAFDLLRQFAKAEQTDHALVGRLGKIYIRQYCGVPADAPLTCLTALSYLSLHFHSLHQKNEVKLTRRRLDQLLDGNEQLRLLMWSGDKHRDETSDRVSHARAELESLVMPFGNVFNSVSDLQQLHANLQEWAVTSYWVTKAAHGQLSRLMRMVPPDEKKYMAVELLSGGFVTALQLDDTSTALESVRILRNFIKDLKLRESEEIARYWSVADMMELGALIVAKQWKDVERLARRIQANTRPFRTKGRNRANTLPCVPGIIIPSRVQTVTGSRDDYFEDLYFASVQVETEAAFHLRKPFPSTRIRELFEHDVLELFRPPPIRDSGFVFRSDQNKEQQFPLSPADFLVNWLHYSKVLGRQRSERIALARAAKCLLRRPELKPALVTSFVNADVENRGLLSDALNQLLDDSDTLNARAKPLADDDFQLLQIAAILQANNGISAATARTVFADKKTRERVRMAEARMSQLTDHLASFQGFAGMFSSKLWGGVADMLDVATVNPAAYARYEELKQQSTATLNEIRGVLRGGEAAVLFVPTEKRLLAVVIRPERATLVTINVPRSLLRAKADQLRASLRFSNRGGRTLPATFQADAGWMLYKTVVRPLEKELDGQTTIYLIGGDELSRIPFQALVTDAPPPQSRITFSSYRSMKWLGDRYEFVSEPSVHALLRIGRKPAEGVGRLLGVGDPAVAVKTLRGLRLDGMPETNRMLQRISKPDDYVPLLGRRASITGLTEYSQSGQMSDADIVLINSHTLPAGKGGHYGTEEPAIVLAPSGGKANEAVDLLDSQKVMELNFSVRLVILLACDTASGRSLDDPQPYAGLVNGFFFAGADTVLATNEPVDASSAEDLAVSFLYQLRDRRLPSSAALQKAVADIRCTDNAAACAVGERSVRAHPAYWANFILVGSGR